MTGFRTEALTSAHPRNEFRCGVAALDRYLAEIATQDIKRRVSQCFVAIDADGITAGYYTFAATGIPLTDLSADDGKRLPRYPLVPAVLIGRLAVDEQYRGRRLGSALVVDAVERAVRADPAIFALVVDAKDPTAAAFYAHLGFRPFQSRPMSLYLSIATALRAVQRPA